MIRSQTNMLGKGKKVVCSFPFLHDCVLIFFIPRSGFLVAGRSPPRAWSSRDRKFSCLRDNDEHNDFRTLRVDPLDRM